MKTIFKNKKIQVAALAVICIAIVIAVLSLNEKRKEELVPDLTRQQLENSEEVLLFFKVERGCEYSIDNETAEEIEACFQEICPGGEFAWIYGEYRYIKEFLNGYLYIMQDGNVYYAEECIVQYGRKCTDYVTTTGELVYDLGRLSTMDLWCLRYCASQIDSLCEYEWCGEHPIVSYEPTLETEGFNEIFVEGEEIGGTIIDANYVFDKMMIHSRCYLNLPGAGELFLILDSNTNEEVAQDDYAKVACLILHGTYGYERMEELFLNRYQAFLDVSPYEYNW